MAEDGRTGGRTVGLTFNFKTREGPDRASFCLGQTEAPTRFARTDRQTDGQANNRVPLQSLEEPTIYFIGENIRLFVARGIAI